MRYLDPRADLTFKRVFGEHPELVKSFLNALLPLKAGDEVKEVEYFPAELMPETPLRKYSIVDVRCWDVRGRQFLVEIQMVWSPEFLLRVSFNDSKGCVRQVGKGKDCRLLQPVYSLNLSTEVFKPDVIEYYHYYRLVHVEHTDRVIDGLHLVFVELPKFTPHSYAERKMQVLWLRYLTEINEKMEKMPEDLLADPLVKKAVEVLEESSFSPAQLLGYEKFWDAISVERTLYNSGERKGRAEGRAEGLAEGERKQQLAIAGNMKSLGVAPEIIAKATGLTLDEIVLL